MKRKGSLVVWFALTLVCGAFAKAGDAAEKQLKQALENQVLSLRVPTGSSKLHFDSNGRAVGTVVPVPWTTGGLLQVKEISLKHDALRIEAQRVLVALRSGKSASSSPSLATILTERSVFVSLDLDPGPVDSKKIGAALGQIFEPVDIQKRIASYWMPAITTTPDVWSAEMGQIVGTLEGGRAVYRAKPGVVELPKTLNAPDPEYSEDARKKHLQGTTELMIVVNEKGLPEILEVVKGLGEGLDVKALEAVSEWRFRPGNRDGEPVAVMLNVQMTFSLY